jgi:uncharacterized Fe-S cluster-containing radical SAM superfamily protein
MNCPEMFDNGIIHCEGGFSGNVNGKGHSSFSILMDIDSEYCNMMCSYCCCHPSEKKVDLYSRYTKDYPKMIAKIKESPLFVKGDTMPHFDLWGGEPLFNTQAVQELVDVLRKEWPECTITISTNGLLLGAKHIVDWILENKISIQLSHDGLGQWIRSQEVDPLEKPLILEGLKRIADAGLFAAVNCTLSYYNSSWYKNIDYFIQHLKYNTKDPIKVGYIKLNHIYNSDYDIKAVNTKGRWQDGFREDLVGKPIGNLALRGRVLDDYLQEFFSLAMFFRSNPNTHSPMELFRSYIMEQSKRWGTVDETKQSAGACRAYQSYVHNIDGNYKSPHTFVITTSGEYSECNLCTSVDDPGSPMTEECSTCRYKDQRECHGCGSMHRPSKCEYLYKFCQTLEKIHLVDIMRNNNNGSNTQPCQK